MGSFFLFEHFAKIVQTKKADDTATTTTISKREYLSMDPLSGQRKLVTIMERALPSGPLRAQSPTLLNGAAAEQSGWASTGGGTGRRLLASAYESRIVEVPPALLKEEGDGGLELEQICGWWRFKDHNDLGEKRM